MGIDVHTGVIVVLRGSCCGGRRVARQGRILCVQFDAKTFANLSDKMWGSFQLKFISTIAHRKFDWKYKRNYTQIVGKMFIYSF